MGYILDGMIYEAYPINKTMYDVIINKLIEEKCLGIFKRTKEEDIIRWHHNLGRYIRNEFLYGNKKPKTNCSEECICLGAQDEDEMSFTIMVQVHNMLNKGYFNLTREECGVLLKGRKLHI